MPHLDLNNMLLTSTVAAGAIAGTGVLSALAFRVVVTTNQVHIVQRGGTTTSYGRGQPAGNTYYRWPSWLPVVGVKVTILPVSIFSRKLANYAAYDIDRVPFEIDVVGFFRIADSNAAAERVKDFSDLEAQLEPILQGAARTILATSTIDEILGSRAVFAEKFTTEVTKDLAAWGVEPVKSIELMDIRDAEGSKSIANIMAKKKSFIEMESRTAVASNNQRASEAEIEAARVVEIAKRTANRAIGIADAEQNQAIGIAQQAQAQAVAGEVAKTRTAEMAVKQVESVRSAEILRDVALVEAEQQQKTAIIKADGTKQQTTIVAEGSLNATKLSAEGIRAEGEAKAKAQELMLLAPVNSQITLAKEIGQNQGYQEYLIKVRTVEAQQAVGTVQAEALKSADIKIVTTASDAASGLDLISLGSKIGGALTALKTITSESGASKT